MSFVMVQLMEANLAVAYLFEITIHLMIILTLRSQNDFLTICLLLGLNYMPYSRLSHILLH